MAFTEAFQALMAAFPRPNRIEAWESIGHHHYLIGDDGKKLCGHYCVMGAVITAITGDVDDPDLFPGDDVLQMFTELNTGLAIAATEANDDGNFKVAWELAARSLGEWMEES